MAYRIEVALKPGVTDPRGVSVAANARQVLGIETEKIETRDVYSIDADLAPEELERIRYEFTDPVIQESSIGIHPSNGFDWMILVGYRPGVTDNVGRSAKTAIQDLIGRPLKPQEGVYTSIAYLINSKGLSRDNVEHLAGDLLANDLIQTVEILSEEEWKQTPPGPNVPKITAETHVLVEEIDLRLADAELVRLSNERTLSLSLAEMRAIRDYFESQGKNPARKAFGLGSHPTDVELEMLAQTWSEHCKHKIFSGNIRYTDEKGQTREIRNLFKTYIQGSTKKISEKVDWLVSVFKDNAGVISFNDRMNVVYKVETHNSPSALDPYGGAMTGIVGVNRDPFGTGLGAALLINVWGYCFGSPFHAGRIPEGLLHPRRIRDGVHQGVIDGGNQSGIPYGLGWEFFDDRYIGKPLVYCGTVGIMPKTLNGHPSHEKAAHPGDLIVMTGGRIGKDGIHGATFSSQELHGESPAQAVQIGDPITQKKMTDFLLEARDLGLYNAITDNGAGGLSSSVGEMCESSGGAELDLEKAPLKYQGLQPWEILLSEAQERMTLAVSPGKIEELKHLAQRREVEVTVLGTFTDTGAFHVRYGNRTVAWVDLEFLHEGFPPLEMEAVWQPPIHKVPSLPFQKDYSEDLGELLGRLNFCSKEYRSRSYDHEVKARAVIKPFIGKNRDIPSDATVTLAEYGGREGIILSMGFNPHYSDIDTYRMMTSVVDTAIRRIIAVGGKLGHIAGLDNFCWPDPVYSEGTPDGRYKLAQLVRANEALYDVTVAFGTPLISGKDSMKNDSVRGGVKISIPPSVLFSAISRMENIEKAVTSDAKAVGDIVYVIGITRKELGASEYLHMLNEQTGGGIGGEVPKVEPEKAIAIYRAISETTENELVRSLHTPALGGLAAGFAFTAMGGELGMNVDLSKIPVEGTLTDAERIFSESNSRFVATVAPEKAEAFEKCLNGIPFARVGEITQEDRLNILGQNGTPVVSAKVSELKKRWKRTLEGV